MSAPEPKYCGHAQCARCQRRAQTIVGILHGVLLSLVLTAVNYVVLTNPPEASDWALAVAVGLTLLVNVVTVLLERTVGDAFLRLAWRQHRQDEP